MDSGADSYSRFLRGDDSGIVEIVRNYKDGLMLYLNGFVQNIHIAEELTEDTFFKLMVKKPKYTEKYLFKTWLYTIGRNIALDYLRKNKRFADNPIEIYQYMLKDEETVEKSYIKEERKIIIHKALSKLKTEYRQVLYLVYFENFNNSEAAAVMKKNKRQIENLIYRAKMSLKSKLDKEGFTYEEL